MCFGSETCLVSCAGLNLWSSYWAYQLRKGADGLMVSICYIKVLDTEDCEGWSIRFSQFFFPTVSFTVRFRV
ncbi:hypothetical protein HanXRQr2_Chr11g0486781 [Helianthus annuus]|uniref:Uncharacterized protein n=1 Tax=Helianthus annuus TaxID=4232 RepID=A0A9K3HNW0_HELAN|nr:hypothetical protein HanXRQr2_Chr11g0486781 [Helianthus annuus]KAJ0509020.1 hypothetical protein HanIR_Chr11g0523921 [Helianthus annuus]KAJ0874831.1 hypothetical protein HanPSC8_Chr11g0468901 [Helianthus annuus]